MEARCHGAKRLMKEAGIQAGTKVTMVTYVRYNYIKEGAQICQQNLREIGLFVDLKILDAGPLRVVRSKRDYDILGPERYPGRTTPRKMYTGRSW